MRRTPIFSISLGLLGLSACATEATQAPSLEIPLRSELTQPCEKLAIPSENQLPSLAQDQATRQAQLVERGYWEQRDVAHEGVEKRICRQRDEAVTLIQQQRQIAHTSDGNSAPTETPDGNAAPPH